ncbi:MAG: type II secretion system F family protein [Patescibacteria group bacterium]|nr:type II secretion system F family protein [Patescibacteria group bacterium]
MRFKYIAYDQGNKIKKGITEASTLKEATSLLISNGWFIKKISPIGAVHKNFDIPIFSGVSLIDKVLMVKHLATMTKSGISLVESLQIITEQATARKFKKVISEILAKVRAGQSLGQALSNFPNIFDPLFINIIKIGEDSGTLEENLEYLSSELEDRLELRRNIQAASFYPAIILSATFGLGLILAYFVLPKIKRLFLSLNFSLPLPTKILIWVADVMDNYGLIIIITVFVAVVLFRILISQKFAKPAWHWLVIKSPIVGQIIINYNLVLISRTLAIVLKSGMTIDQGIKISIETTNNYVYKKLLSKVLPQINRGKSLNESLQSIRQSSRRPYFPLLLIKMIGVGERSGRLDESLTYLSEYFEKEVNNASKNMSTVLEPALLLFVGAIVGFVAISVISPIYQITAKFNQ